ncbi:MAG: peptidoglycan DD-metalloendopeptidase family protein [Patescibacteria group bacterium]
MKFLRPYKYFATLAVILTLAFFFVISSTNASEIDDLRARIEDRNNKIQAIEAEITKYQQELAKTEGESLTLQNTIKSLNISRNKYLQEIKLTENKIQALGLEIKKISYNIEDKESKIEQSSDAIALSIRKINEITGESLFATVLKYNKLSDYFGGVSDLETLQKGLGDAIKALSSLKDALEKDKDKAEVGKSLLISYNDDLKDQKKIVENNKAEKNRLLAMTKNKEAAYKKLIEEKVANKKQFENELFLYESELKIKIDPSLIPSAGKGVLFWPLDLIYITQRFGKTVDAKILYVSGSHSGVDFRASIGTKVKSVLSGTVEATGDTDKTCPNASYGKWVLLKHANGLSSLYAHLDIISVSKGESLITGDKVGYSGNTGYSTGPHLHLTIFATQGMKIGSLPSSSCKGAIYTIPVADPKAYLNPLDYF